MQFNQNMIICQNYLLNSDLKLNFITRQTRSSADAEGPHDASLRNTALEKACKNTQGHYNCCY